MPNESLFIIPHPLWSRGTQNEIEQNLQRNIKNPWEKPENKKKIVKDFKNLFLNFKKIKTNIPTCCPAPKKGPIIIAFAGIAAFVSKATYSKPATNNIFDPAPVTNLPIKNKAARENFSRFPFKTISGTCPNKPRKPKICTKILKSFLTSKVCGKVAARLKSIPNNMDNQAIMNVHLKPILLVKTGFMKYEMEIAPVK